MQVTNNTGYAIIAFCFDTRVGYGEDVAIPPGQTVEVPGPYIGMMGGGACYVVVKGKIICHETPDDDNSFQVTRGNPLDLESGGKGICVRHYLDVLEKCVLQWRQCNKRTICED